MSEAYQQKEWELDSLIDNLNSIEYTYEEYKKEVEYFIDGLLKDTKEINTLRNENKRLNNIINEALELIYANAYDTERKECIDDLWGNIEELVDILKGNDKEC